MDFKQLMDLAAQNKGRGKRQDTKELTGKISEGKSSKSGVSDEAVKAFLLKRELEKKKKAAEEEAARRARIEERLAHSLGGKRTEHTDGASYSQRTKKTPELHRTENHPDKNNQKQKVSEHRDTKTTHGKTSQKPETSGTRHFTVVNNKNCDSHAKKSVHKGKMKASAPMDFKALLAVAERNKNGGGKVLEPERNVKKEQNKVKEACKKKSGQEHSNFNKGQHRTLGDGKTNGQMQVKGSSKPQVKDTAVKMLSSVGDSKIRQGLKRPVESLNGSKEKRLDRKMPSASPASGNNGKLKPSVMTHSRHETHPLREGHLASRKNRDMLKRKMNPCMDDIDDMDDFIDDGDGGDVDVSKYIKEIFGYDKTRFRDDDDDDLAGMESSYTQIEREEVKSSKIARLEDEIEQLKELHELKKQRDNLKRKAKM